MPEFEEVFGPHWGRQDNPEDYAIIDFEYHGTFDSIAWLGHELGHAIADDIQQQNGHSFRDFTDGELEQQAHFVQHIVSRHLQEKYPGLNARDLGEATTEWSDERQQAYTSASGAFARAASATDPGARNQAIQETLDPKLKNKLTAHPGAP